jgi:signal transduction histidine kinase
MTTIATPLVRPRQMVVAGVCAGLAQHLGWPVRRVRGWMIVLSALGGAGILLYLWLWAFAPVYAAENEITRRVPVGALLVSGGAVAAIAAVALANAGANPSAAVAWTIVLTGGAVAWSLAFDRQDPTRSTRYELLVRSLGAALFILTGMLLLLSRGARPDAITAVLAVFMIVLGVAVVAAPGVVRLWSELMAERAGRVREEQRAEIAAHLHDSVLQTLALIQNRAGASSEVARLARAQERELRDWLFAGTAPAGEDLATELRDVAAAIELDYPARLEVVAAGESTGVSSSALVAAAREAMLNAARHAGGDVSVYLESAGSIVDVFIRDRGPGIDLATLPADRLGIRESIIGRMTRAGGTATVGHGAGGVGTEVHLHLEVPQ